MLLRIYSYQIGGVLQKRKTSVKKKKNFCETVKQRLIKKKIGTGKSLFQNSKVLHFYTYKIRKGKKLEKNKSLTKKQNMLCLIYLYLKRDIDIPDSYIVSLNCSSNLYIILIIEAGK